MARTSLDAFMSALPKAPGSLIRQPQDDIEEKAKAVALQLSAAQERCQRQELVVKGLTDSVHSLRLRRSQLIRELNHEVYVAEQGLEQESKKLTEYDAKLQASIAKDDATQHQLHTSRTQMREFYATVMAFAGKELRKLEAPEPGSTNHCTDISHADQLPVHVYTPVSEQASDEASFVNRQSSEQTSDSDQNRDVNALTQEKASDSLASVRVIEEVEHDRAVLDMHSKVNGPRSYNRPSSAKDVSSGLPSVSEPVATAPIIMLPQQASHDGARGVSQAVDQVETRISPYSADGMLGAQRDVLQALARGAMPEMSDANFGHGFPSPRQSNDFNLCEAVQQPRSPVFADKPTSLPPTNRPQQKSNNPIQCQNDQTSTTASPHQSVIFAASPVAASPIPRPTSGVANVHTPRNTINSAKITSGPALDVNRSTSHGDLVSGNSVASSTTVKMVLTNDGHTYTAPECLRGVPMQKIDPSHEYWDDGWEDLEAKATMQIQLLQEKLDLKRRANPGIRDGAPEISPIRQIIRRWEEIRDFIQTGEISPYQLLNKRYMKMGAGSISTVDTLFRFVGTLKTLHAVKTGLTPLEPLDWLRCRLWEIVLQEDRRFNFAKTLQEFYTDPKFAALRVEQGLGNVGRPRVVRSSTGSAMNHTPEALTKVGKKRKATTIASSSTSWLPNGRKRVASQGLHSQTHDENSSFQQPTMAIHQGVEADDPESSELSDLDMESEAPSEREPYGIERVGTREFGSLNPAYQESPGSEIDGGDIECVEWISGGYQVYFQMRAKREDGESPQPNKEVLIDFESPRMMQRFVNDCVQNDIKVVQVSP